MQLTQAIVRELLDYCPETGTLTWKTRDIRWFKDDPPQSKCWVNAAQRCQRWNTRYAGKSASDAGSGAAKSYRAISILNRRYWQHRIIFLWMVGRWPDPEVDHINRDSHDNRWKNLREATERLNSYNQRVRKNNTSGVRGVSRHQDGGWQVRITGKYFGIFKTIEEAIAVRKRAETQHEAALGSA